MAYNNKRYCNDDIVAIFNNEVIKLIIFIDTQCFSIKKIWVFINFPDQVYSNTGVRHESDKNQRK